MNDKVVNILGIALLFFTGLGGMAGGIGLMQDPSGNALGMSTDLLKHAPFADFFYPGLLLFAIIGAGHFLGGFLSILNRNIAIESYIVCGVALTIWIVTQVIMIGLVSILQPLFLLIGIIEILVGILAIRKHRESFVGCKGKKRTLN